MSDKHNTSDQSDQPVLVISPEAVSEPETHDQDERNTKESGVLEQKVRHTTCDRDDVRVRGVILGEKPPQ